MNQPRIIEVTPLEDYKLFLVYETEEKRVFDVSPYIRGDWYGKLRDASYFKSVHISGNTVEWAGGQDLAPHELYEHSVSV